MDLQATLIALAEDHLTTMRGVPWSAFANTIHARWPASAGETFGCEVDGVYFDVGDNVRWAVETDGDILLTAHARSPDQVADGRTERSVVIPRPK